MTGGKGPGDLSRFSNSGEAVPGQVPRTLLKP
jgi:hypothetical protein